MALTLLPPFLPTLNISMGTPPAGMFYSSAPLYTASGGTGPYSWSVISGTLPTGLSLVPTGVSSQTLTIQGTPTQSTLGSSISITVQAQDTIFPNDTGSKPLSLNVINNSAPIVSPVSGSTLPDGQVGVPYSFSITSLDWDTVTYQLVSGTFPSGLTFNADGTISGTPVPGDAGTYTFYFDATDASGNKTFNTEYTITILPAPRRRKRRIIAPAPTICCDISNYPNGCPDTISVGGYIYIRIGNTNCYVLETLAKK